MLPGVRCAALNRKLLNLRVIELVFCTGSFYALTKEFPDSRTTSTQFPVNHVAWNRQKFAHLGAEFAVPRNLFLNVVKCVVE